MNSDQKLLEGLRDESERLDGMMDEMIAEMESTPEGARTGELWDAFTKRFTTLQAAQRDVGHKIKQAKAALASPEPPSTRKH